MFGGRKLMRFFEPGGSAPVAVRAFDLAADPRETRGLQSPGSLEVMIETLSDTSGLVYAAVDETLGDETQQRLRTLGYLD